MHTCHRAGEAFHLRLPPGPDLREEDTATLSAVQGWTIIRRVCLTFTTTSGATTGLPVYVAADGTRLTTVPDASTMVRPHTAAALAKHLERTLAADLACPCATPALASAAAHQHPHPAADTLPRVEQRATLIGTTRLLAAARGTAPDALEVALAALQAGCTCSPADVLRATTGATT